MCRMVRPVVSMDRCDPKVVFTYLQQVLEPIYKVWLPSWRQETRLVYSKPPPKDTPRGIFLDPTVSP